MYAVITLGFCYYFVMSVDITLILSLKCRLLNISSAMYTFQGASKALKVGENMVRVLNSLDPDESNSASHLDPSVLIW